MDSLPSGEYLVTVDATLGPHAARQAWFAINK